MPALTAAYFAATRRVSFQTLHRIIQARRRDNTHPPGRIPRFRRHTEWLDTAGTPRYTGGANCFLTSPVTMHDAAHQLDALCIYCGSRPGEDPEFLAAARQLGRRLASDGIDLVYGGAKKGMMGAAADAALDAGGDVIGILPGGLASREKAHTELTELHVVDSMHQRKAMMERLSDGFIALPGGLGTLEELCEVTTWAQLGIHRKPVGLCNVNNYFGGFLAFLDHAVDCRFLPPEHRDLLIVDDNPDQLIERMSQFEPFLDKTWLDESQI